VRLFFRLLIPACVVAAGIASLGPSAAAQDSKALLAKQKETVVANLKQAELSKTTVVETENFFVAGLLPDEKAKSLGSVLEKVVPLVRKALQYESKEETWKGKLAVYYFPESRDYKTFMPLPQQ
jgi:histidinol-phosphate/aromatic aminotransferase/cobyric acid decarboxylase-like protein